MSSSPILSVSIVLIQIMLGGALCSTVEAQVTFDGASRDACSSLIDEESPSRHLAQVINQEPVWSEDDLSADTRVIYVSSSEGSDSNSGFSENDPVRTLEEAESRMRDGFPDWLLLKRGDVWDEGFGTWTLSGRSESEPMIVGAYGSGTERPHLRPPNKGFYLLGSPRHLWITSLRITRTEYSQYGSGVYMHLSGSDGEDLLLEDLYISGFDPNIGLSAVNDSLVFRNLRIRGVVSVDAVRLLQDGTQDTGTTTQGLFLNHIDGALIERCVFDHNGRSQDPNLDISGIHSHNVYCQLHTKNIVVRDSIFANAGSHSLKLLGGGTVEDCLFLENPLALLCGYTGASSGVGATSTIQNNIVLGSQPINSSTPRGYGIQLANCKDTIVQDNVIAHNTTQPYGVAISVEISNESACDNLNIIDNYAFNWLGATMKVSLIGESDYDLKIKRNHFDGYYQAGLGESFVLRLNETELASEIEFQDNTYYVDSVPVFAWIGNQWLDYGQWQASANDVGSVNEAHLAGRWDSLTIEAYQASIGQSPTLNSFMAGARKQQRDAWDSQYTSDSVWRYMATELAKIDLGVPEEPGPICHGDFNDDSVVDVDDFSILLLEYGAEGKSLNADLNQDGIVDLFDFTGLLIYFGESCDHPSPH
ncbi:MAG: right-handed parallel beta-helix repeat-containing protein [Phycisphaerales bacterium]|nr:right-handed parallel beta-helix repeat-containing protein [Phycisphaerales bacterium]